MRNPFILLKNSCISPSKSTRIKKILKYTLVSDSFMLPGADSRRMHDNSREGSIVPDQLDELIITPPISAHFLVIGKEKVSGNET